MFKIEDYRKVCRISGIYKIYSKDSEKVYVGSSIDMRKRAYSHYHELIKGRHHSSGLQELFQREPLFFETLECCDRGIMGEREDYWIDHYDSINNGYNSYRASSSKRSHNNERHAFSVIKVELLCHLLLMYVKGEIDEFRIYEVLCKVLDKDSEEVFKHRELTNTILSKLRPCWRYYCSLYMSQEVANYFSCGVVSNFDDFIGEGTTVSSLVRHIRKLRQVSFAFDTSIEVILSRLENTATRLGL